MERPEDFEPGEWKETPTIGGMKTWCCTYERDGKQYGISLMGTDPDQVLEDNCEELPGLRVEGQLMLTAHAVRRK